MSKQIYGELVGIKQSIIRNLESYYSTVVPQDEVISKNLAKNLLKIAREINRSIALLIDRKGIIKYIIIGKYNKIYIPELGRFRAGKKRFRGLRLFQINLNYEEISMDNLTDLYKLRLDMLSVLTSSPLGEPGMIYSVVINPEEESNYRYLDPISIHETDIGFIDFINDLESEFSSTTNELEDVDNKENAIIVYACNQGKEKIKNSINEIKALCYTAGINIVDIVIQNKKINPKTVIGLGKIEELLILLNKKNCSLVIFNHTLSPTQIRIITSKLDEKIIDRNMLILDIFAQNARTNDGKIKVELAQLKYMAPRLISASRAFSRLAGGIGGRGPGEKKLEIDKRRIQKRITILSNKLKSIENKRELQRKKRINSSAKIISLVGYTNAGKSTILNKLTNSKLIAQDKLFSTLETKSKAIFYDNNKYIINDTVGFIESLPNELIDAFKASIEEIIYSDLIIHVVDVSDENYREKLQAVDNILLNLGVKPGLVKYVFNKIDLIKDEKILNFRKMTHYKKLFISAECDFDSNEFLESILG